MTRQFKSGPAAVYRHLNAVGETLYIGCSLNPAARFATHKSTSSWAYDVTSIEIIWFDRIEDALREEARLIESEQPPMNRQGVVDRPRNWSCSNGPAIFSLWLEDVGLTPGDVANAIGRPKQQIAAMLKPTARPRFLTQILVAAATGGFVPDKAWDRYSNLMPVRLVTPVEAADHLQRARAFLKSRKVPLPAVVLNNPAKGATA